MGGNHQPRRRFLAAVGVAAATAGCTTGDPGTPGNGGTASGTTTSDPTTTTTSGPSYNAPAWFTDRGDLQHTASANGSISLPLSERWRTTLGGTVQSAPIGGHGNVLVGSDDGKLYALDPTDGSIAWTYDAGSPVTTPATAVAENKGADEYVWVGTKDGVVHSVDPATGSANWTTSTGTGAQHSAVNYASGLVFHVQMNGPTSSSLHAFDGATGSHSWSVALGNESPTTPMHGMGSVHVGLEQGVTVFEAYDALEGSKEWDLTNRERNAGSSTSGVLDTDVPKNDPARVITSTENGYVGAYRAGVGTELWRTDLSEYGTVEGLALTQGRSQNVLVVAQRNALYGLDPATGAVSWTYAHGPTPHRNPKNASTGRTAQPAIYGDYVFQIVGGTKLVAVDLSSGTEAWSASVASSTVTSPAVGGGTVYVADANGDVVAYSP